MVICRSLAGATSVPPTPGAKALIQMRQPARWVVAEKTYSPLLRREVGAIDNTLPLINVQTMDAVVRASMSRTSFTTFLLATTALAPYVDGLPLPSVGVIVPTAPVQRRSPCYAAGHPGTALSSARAASGKPIIAALALAVPLHRPGVSVALRHDLTRIRSDTPRFRQRFPRGWGLHLQRIPWEHGSHVRHPWRPERD